MRAALARRAPGASKREPRCGPELRDRIASPESGGVTEARFPERRRTWIEELRSVDRRTRFGYAGSDARGVTAMAARLRASAGGGTDP